MNFISYELSYIFFYLVAKQRREFYIPYFLSFFPKVLVFAFCLCLFPLNSLTVHWNSQGAPGCIPLGIRKLVSLRIFLQLLSQLNSISNF